MSYTMKACCLTWSATFATIFYPQLTLPWLGFIVGVAVMGTVTILTEKVDL